MVNCRFRAHKIAENESLTATDFVQGANSWASKLGNFSIEEASNYGGMAPPNCKHRYELIVYALDTKLNLTSGFRLMICILQCKDIS
ncbi:phospholipid-binding protein [Actinobacillus equuli]|nr:phospholipid-binding protein [Actinobacillus equuli]